MRILFDLNHPAHFHLLKNAINELKRKGHQIWITARKKDVLLDLLDINIQEYILLDKSKNKIKDHFRNLIKLRRVFKKESIDLAIGVSVLITQASLFTKTKSIVLDDDDFKATPLFALASHTFANHILVPEVLKNTKKKYIYHEGFHELAYLHPKRFKADINILKKIGVKKEEPYFVLRFVALKGHHDGGHKGISLDQKRQLINYLATYGHIFITSEKQIEDEFEKYRLPIPPEEIHSLLYYAIMFLGDSQTMTSEAAILGTPALKCNTFAGKLSVPNELEEKYGLCYSYQPNAFDQFMNKAKELSETPNLKEAWAEKRQKFLNDKIDVTAFMVWFIENYPKSAKIMKENPDYQYRFK